MDLGGHKFVPMYAVAKNSNGKTNISRTGFCFAQCKVINSMICSLWTNSIQKLLSWKGSICFKKSFEEKHT
jgi:hypothetical protein